MTPARMLNAAGLLVGIALVAIVTHEVAGQRAPAESAGPCACAVVVSLPKVLEGLTQRGDAELGLQKLATGLQDTDADWQQRLKAKQAELDEIADTDHDQRNQVSDDLKLMKLEYQAWRAYAAEHMDIEKSLLYRELSRKIDAAIAELAKVNGYDLVLMDDSGAALSVNPDSKVPRELQVKQQLTSRRVLYADGMANVTDALIQRMNNDYQSGTP